MVKQVLRFLVPAAVIIVAVILWMAHNTPVAGNQTASSNNNQLRVNPNSSQPYTNVTGDSLQLAVPPPRSATSAELSPQQASPNYCLPGEMPIVDGCISR